MAFRGTKPDWTKSKFESRKLNRLNLTVNQLDETMCLRRDFQNKNIKTKFYRFHLIDWMQERWERWYGKNRLSHNQDLMVSLALISFFWFSLLFCFVCPQMIVLTCWTMPVDYIFSPSKHTRLTFRTPSISIILLSD